MSVGSMIVLAVIIFMIVGAILVLVHDHRMGRCACGCEDCNCCCSKCIEIDDKQN